TARARFTGGRCAGWDGAVHGPAVARRRRRRAAGETDLGRALAHSRLRRSGPRARAGLEHARVAGPRGHRAAWHLLVALATSDLGERRDLRKHAAPRACGPRL